MVDTARHFLRSFLPCAASHASAATAQPAPLPPHLQVGDFLHAFLFRGAHPWAAAPRAAAAASASAAASAAATATARRPAPRRAIPPPSPLGTRPPLVLDPPRSNAGFELDPLQ